MPRKIRQLKQDLRNAGFHLQPGRGKGSHTVWTHPNVREPVVLSGADGDDAQPYQERNVRQSIAQAADGDRSRP